MIGAAVAGLVGAAVGSCLGALAARWPDLDRGFVLGRSHCESCGATLRWSELVPVGSWLAQHGRCRRCGEPIGALPLLAELAGLAIAVLGVATLGLAAGLLFLLVGWWLLALALIDGHHGRLPDALTLPLLALGLAAAAFLPIGGLVGPLDSLLGAALGYAVFVAVGLAYRRWRGREGLGRGDAKLLAALGAWLGPQGLAPTILLGATAALVVALVSGLRRGDDALPFGPWLAMAGGLLLWWRLWLAG